jgi:hypothetical protein
VPYTDAVAFHGYLSAPEDVLGMVAAVKSSMLPQGAAGKPIWDTEGSWGLDSNFTDPSHPPGFLARDFLLEWSSGVSRFYWYAWNNSIWGTLWTSEGIQPAGIAYGQMYKWTVGAKMILPCTMAPDSTWTCTFTRPGGVEALAVWNSSTTTVYTPAGQFKLYLDLVGNMHPISGSISIGYNPILLLNQSPPASPSNMIIVSVK